MKELNKEKKVSKSKKIILLLILFIGIAFASISTTISFNGNVSVRPNSWDIHFEDITVSDGSMTPLVAAVIDENNHMQINFGLELTTPGEYYEFEVDVVNSGTVDARLSSIDVVGFTPAQEKYLDYTIEYVDGSKIKIGDTIGASSKKRIKFKLEFLYDIEDSDLPSEGTTNTFKLNLNYIQNKKNDGEEKPRPPRPEKPTPPPEEED